MTDSMGTYSGSFRPKRLTRREIDKMKKIMKTAPLIAKKNDLHHQDEEKEAEEMFEKEIGRLEEK